MCFFEINLIFYFENADIEFGFKVHIHSPKLSPNSKRAATLGINGLF